MTADEVDAGDLTMRVRVNGETWGEDNSSNMHHKFADMIAYVSQAQTIYPGEFSARVLPKAAQASRRTAT